MKKRIVIAVAAFVFTSGLTYAQEQNYTTYRVSKGETISKIAREHKISVSEILRLNPEAKTGIKEGDVIQVPAGKTQATAAVTNKNTTQTTPPTDTKRKTHLVQAKETVFGISRQYNVSVQDLYQWNPELERNGLKANSYLYIAPSATTAPTDQSTQVNVVLAATKADTPLDKAKVGYKEIEIEPKQTLYSLAVEYQTSVQKIMELNPELNEGLKSGQKIKVPVVGQKGTATSITSEVKPTTTGTTTKGSGSYRTVTIEPKQTLFSLAKENNISIEELVELNPELRKGLQVGMEVKLPNTAGEGKTEPTTTQPKWNMESSGSFVDLTQSLDRYTSKELVLLLPFNTSRIGDAAAERMKTDGFLNMTMDFYLGAKLAIDKAVGMGLPLTVKVFDSNETKNSSDVKRILTSENLTKTEVVIGPFFQTNVDDAVKALPNNDIVLVSPLSNEKANPSSQLVQTMPYGDVLKQSLLEYFIQKDSKITVIVDEKKASTKRFMQRHYPNIKLLETKDLKDIDKTLVAGKNNAFILDSNSIESALLLTDKLKNKTSQFDIQVASFDKSEVFDYGEIKIETLVALHYTFPSVTRDSESSLDTAFAREYKAQNNALPNRFAIRGYDVTLDVILRMFQKDGFTGAMGLKSTEIENKFVYSKNPEGTVRNRGVYILQYNDDLTVKVVE